MEQVDPQVLKEVMDATAQRLGLQTAEQEGTVQVANINGKVVVHFGRMVDSLALSPDAALKLSRLLVTAARGGKKPNRKRR